MARAQLSRQPSCCERGHRNQGLGLRIPRLTPLSPAAEAAEGPHPSGGFQKVPRFGFLYLLCNNSRSGQGFCPKSKQPCQLPGLSEEGQFNLGAFKPLSWPCMASFCPYISLQPPPPPAFLGLPLACISTQIRHGKPGFKTEIWACLFDMVPLRGFPCPPYRLGRLLAP